MKENMNFKNAAQGSNESTELESMELAVILGEKLGDALLACMAVFGSSYDALVAQTYAMSKAWAFLQVIARKQDADMEELFRELQPSFQKDAEEVLESLNEDED